MALKQSKELLKCCICLNVSTDPLMLCKESHMACFECMISYFQSSKNDFTCPVCRSRMSMHFNRVITESAKIHTKRKRKSQEHIVFEKLLKYRKRFKFQSFHHIFRRFSCEVCEGHLTQIENDINILIESVEARKRLLDSKLID